MEKAKYWQAIMYPDNMIDDWFEEIYNLVQVPFAYCIHNQCKDKSGNTRKIHVHIILAFPNTTTKNHALRVFKKLEKQGCSAIPNDIIEQVINIRHAYDYLIHDTKDCEKKHKFKYAISDRITGNNFDIGSYEQLSSAEKNDIARTLCNLIIDKNYCNFADFYMYVVSTYDTAYFEVLKTNSGLFERLTKGNYQKLSFSVSRGTYYE